MSLLVYLSMMFVVSVYTGALTPAVRWFAGTGPLAPGDSDIGSTITQVFALLVVILWSFRRFSRMRDIVRGLLPYMVILVVCFASIRWSSYPYNSLRRSITLTVCVFYGAYLFDRLGLDGMIRLFERTALVLAVLSFIAYFGLPRVGRDTAEGYSGAMRGVFAAKNTAGMAMLLALTCTLYLGSLPGANRLLATGSVLLAFATLVMTKSATSLLIALSVIGLGSRLWMRSPQMRLLWTASLLFVFVFVFFTLVFWPDQIFPLIGRDASFTGRMPLWQESLKMIAKRPMLGYGYSGFWNADSRDVQYLWRVIGWNAPNGHDGYIDILLQIGAVGLLLYMVMWVRLIASAVRHSRQHTLAQAPWILLLMLVNVLLNIDEGPLPYPDQFTLFVAGVLLAVAQAKRPDGQPHRVAGLTVPLRPASTRVSRDLSRSRSPTNECR